MNATANVLPPFAEFFSGVNDCMLLLASVWKEHGRGEPGGMTKYKSKECVLVRVYMHARH